MILAGVFFVLLLSTSQVLCQENAEGGAPILGASAGNINAPRPSNLLPEYVQTDDEIPFNNAQALQSRPTRGYVYPKPANPLELPPFTTLDASAPLDGFATFRSRRSPQRQTFLGRPFRPTPQYYHGFIPPNFVRPFPGTHYQGAQRF